MKNALITLLFALGVLFTTPCLADEIGLPHRPNYEKNVRIFVKEEATGYESKGYKKPKVKVRIGHSFLIPGEMREKWEKNKWLRVTSGLSDYVPYWIETKYLTSEDKLKKVTKDWPVRYLYASGADCMYYLNFTPSGEVDIQVCDDKTTSHVYRDGPIVKVPFMTKKHGLTLVGLIRLDEKNRLYAVFTAGDFGEYEKQGLFTDPKKPVISPWGKCILDCPDQATLALHNSLTQALRDGNLTIVKKYIPGEIDVNVLLHAPKKREKRDRTPLMIAAEKHRSNVVEYLLAKKADIHAIDDDLMTAYFYAANFIVLPKNKDAAVQTIKLLLEAGAEVDSSRRQKATPLFFAASSGFVEMVQLLIKHGADINVRSKGGLVTPLISAARYGHYDVARVLIQNVADLNTKSKKGKTAVDFTIARQDKKMFGLLYDAGAKVNLP